MGFPKEISKPDLPIYDTVSCQLLIPPLTFDQTLEENLKRKQKKVNNNKSNLLKLEYAGLGIGTSTKLSLISLKTQETLQPKQNATL